MSELSFLVERLNQNPFNKGFSLVTFDELTPWDLLSLVQELFEYLDPKHKEHDIREDSLDKTKTRMYNFLMMLKYQVPLEDNISKQESIERFKSRLVDGQRGVIYSVLHYILSKLEPLKTRAYLANFLVNIDIPAEFLYDEQIQSCHQQHKSLQEAFKETHKKVGKLRHNTLAPAELKKEISQLEEEKSQLKEKISQLERRTKGMNGFEELFKVTSLLRQTQEEDKKLQERGREQQQALHDVERIHAEVSRQLAELQNANNDHTPASELLNQLGRQVEEKRALFNEALPRDIENEKTKVLELQSALMEPPKTESDVEELENMLDNMNRSIDNFKSEISRYQRMGSDSKLKMFRQQSAMVAEKLQQTQKELDELLEERQKIDTEMQGKERQLSSLSGSQYMKRDEFKQYASTLRQKTSDHRRKKNELAALRAESVILSRTEAILRARCKNVEEFTKKMEEEKGVSGYTKTKAELEKLSRDTANINSHKGKTLDEISRIVKDTDIALAEKKGQLTPLIAELKAVRPLQAELLREHTEKKAVYDNIAVGLESERIELEQECNAYQEESLRQESRYHYVNCLSNILDSNLERVQEELEYSKGNGRLLRDFQTYKDLYQQKISQQEQLSKELRKKQKQLKENANSNTQQRQLFVDLKKLLGLKVQVKQSSNQPTGTEDGFFDMGQDVGGANIMTIES